MTTLVLHIGSPKAGSSAIQASLEAQRWSRRWCALSANPYGKPYPSGFIAGLYLQPKALPRCLAQRLQQDPDRFARDLKRYRRMLASQLQPRWRPRPVAAVLSCEYLWRLPAASVQQLRADFEALGVTRFLVLAFVREPSSLYGSALQQWARLSTDLQRFDPYSWRYELRQRLETWSAVFADSLVVRPYHRSQLHQGCVVADLQQQLQQRLADLPGLPVLRMVPAVNRSFSTEELVAMHELMQRQPGGAAQASIARARALRRLWDDLKLRLQERQGSSIRVRVAVQTLIRRRHQADLDWLADQYGVWLSGADEQVACCGPEPSGEGAWALLDLLEECRQPQLLEELRARLAQERLPAV
ncbi:MAG: hypothetical protein FJ076_12620 [Cyanobacteria bacterium K_DeepCast_35m_m1_288]|nr:hypothetical protein [Cyanobacteria bacterium K_DeepCast_35m_m1_288]